MSRHVFFKAQSKSPRRGSVETNHRKRRVGFRVVRELPGSACNDPALRVVERGAGRRSRSQAFLTVPQSPSSSTGVIPSHGMFIFVNQDANASLSGASMTQKILPSARFRKLR